MTNLPLRRPLNSGSHPAPRFGAVFQLFSPGRGPATARALQCLLHQGLNFSLKRF